MSYLDSEERLQLESIIKLEFQNEALLDQALIHASYVNEHPEATSNDRLEFLGDAVIGLVIAEECYRKLPEATEEELTENRKARVNQGSEAQAARKMNLNEFLQVGAGETRKGEFNNALVGDCYEAIVGVVFLEFGYDEASKLVLETLI